MHQLLAPLGLIPLLAFGLASCSQDEAKQPSLTPTLADSIYFGGNIITMDDSQPQVAAVAVKDGKILMVGDKNKIMESQGENTTIVDLQGKTLLPGFVDSHGHTYMQGLQATTANLLPPPDGLGSDVDSIVTLLKDWADNNAEVIENVGWIAGFGYDDSQLKEQRHPTRKDLDRVSTEIPIVIIHQSGHLGVANSKALEIAGVTAATKNPQGGRYRRFANSNEPNGVAEEFAFFNLLMHMASKFTPDINETLVKAGAKQMASFGYTTAQEGRAMGDAMNAMKKVADDGGLTIDLVAYPDIMAVKDIQPSATYQGRYRVGGAKLTIDGSPQGKTAWLTQPYFVPPEGQEKGYKGYTTLTQEQVNGFVEKAYSNDWQIIIHANGDAAIDSMITAIDKAKKAHTEVDNRPVLIHGQVTRRDQVSSLKKLGIFPSLFPMHTFYWGDWHRDSVLGAERAENISPTGWVLEEGMIFGTHHDAPVALPDSMRVLSATVTRTTRTGDVLGENHRVPVMTALKAMTIWPAWQHFEEDTKGSIEVGKLADFVVLSDDPLTIAPEKIAGIKILKTIKEDKVVYERPAKMSAISSPAPFGTVLNENPYASHVHVHVHGDGCFNPGFDLLYRAIHSSPRLE